MELYKDSPLGKAIITAIKACYADVPKELKLEEHGGWLLKKDETYEFHPLKNDNTGTDLANVLFMANRVAVGNGPLKKIVYEKWCNYATFHTHPQFSVLPSTLDLNVLFKCSAVNFIYSQATNQIGCYVCINGYYIRHIWDVTEDYTFNKTNNIKKANEALKHGNN